MAPEHTNGNGTNGAIWSGMPWWVRATALVGVPTLISLGTVYFLATNVTTAQARVLDNQQTILAKQAEVQATQAHIDADLDTLATLARASLRYQRQTCLNTAKMAGLSGETCVAE